MVLKFLALLVVVAAIGESIDSSVKFEQQNTPFQEKSLSNEPRKRVGCKTIGGTCISSDVDCPSDKTLETGLGLPFCSNTKRCCYPGNSCPKGFQNAAPLNKCLLQRGMLKWRKARNVCKRRGLQLLQPDDPMTLRRYMRENMDTTTFDSVWLDGRGDGYSMVRSNGTPISNGDIHWYGGGPWYVTKKYCLQLEMSEDVKPYNDMNCKESAMTWCEMPAPAEAWTWHTVGSDRFVSFYEMGPMSWTDARAVCTNHGLDLYEPQDNAAVSQYLLDNIESSWSILYFWIGGRGNSTHNVWLSGGEIPYDADAWRYSYSGYADCFDDCMWFGAAASYGGKNIGCNYCTNSGWNRPLCG